MFWNTSKKHMANAAAIAEKATSSKLKGPDWALNIELCDILNADPRQMTDALNMVKKQLLKGIPQKQLLALFVLETLSKNCGEYIFLGMVDLGILNEMVKIAMKKADLNVRNKILTLIDIWQEALGGAVGSFHLYFDAYVRLKSFGLKFPPREENNVPFVTPPEMDQLNEEAAARASPDSGYSGLSLAGLESAADLAGVLLEMLASLDPNSHLDGAIAETVDQCRLYKKRVENLVNSSTLDEGLLCKGLEVNHDLQRVLSKHDDIVNRITTAPVANGGIMASSEGSEEGHGSGQLRIRSRRQTVQNDESISTESASVGGSVCVSLESTPPTHNSSSIPMLEDKSRCKQGQQSCDKVDGGGLCSGATFEQGSSSIKSTAVDEEEERREEALFRELVEFAKAQASSSLKPRRAFQCNNNE